MQADKKKSFSTSHFSILQAAKQWDTKRCVAFVHDMTLPLPAQPFLDLIDLQLRSNSFVDTSSAIVTDRLNNDSSSGLDVAGGAGQGLVDVALLIFTLSALSPRTFPGVVRELYRVC